MKLHTPECHSKYITWGGKPRPCNCDGPTAVKIGASVAALLVLMFIIAMAAQFGVFK